MNWKKVKLKELLTIKNGKDHKALKDGIYPVYGSGGIMRYADKYLYDQESILLPRKGTLNNIQFAKTPFWTVDTCYYTVVNIDKVVPYFLYRNLRQFDIEALNTGSAVPSMTFDKYYTIEINLPDLLTQRRIASILSRYDSLIENYQKQIKLLEESAQRLYKEWFVDLRFPGHENTKIVDGVPEGWEKKKISEIAILKAGGDKPKIVSENRTDICNIPIYSNGTSNEGLYGYTNKPEITDHCVTISARGSVGYAVMRRNSFVPIVRLISVIPQSVYVGYLYFYIKQMPLDSNGAAQQQITIPMIRNKEIIIPSNLILNELERSIEPIFKNVDNIKSQIRHLTEARDRLLPKLMNGEIEV